MFHFGQEVAGHEDGVAVGGSCPEQVSEGSDALGVESVSWFVEDEDRWVTEEGGGEAEALSHAEGVGAGVSVGGMGDVDEFEHLLDPGVGDASSVGQDAEVVSATAAGVESIGLDDRTDGTCRVGEVSVEAAPDRCRPVIG